MPSEHFFAYDPRDFGIPTREELVDLRIWDLHFHGFNQMEKVMPFIDRFGVEKLFALGFGRLQGETPDETRRIAAERRAELAQWRDRVFGVIVIDPGDPDGSVELMKEWIENGPCVGIKYSGRNQAGVTCAHPNNDPIIRYAAELGAVIYIHTWIKVDATPRYPGSNNNPGESTPMDVAVLAQRFPDVPMICGHQGGDWELGTRAIRATPNVYFEFSGADPEAGQVDFAVKELGAERIVWGGHHPTRSFGNELSTVFNADLSHRQRKQILGENLRRLSAAILKDKGIPVVI